MERDDGGEAGDDVLAERAAGTLDGLLAGGAGDDQFRQHGVELAADDGAGAHTGIDTHARARRLGVGDHGARGRHEVGGGVLAVDAEFDGVAVRGGVFVDKQGLAAGDAELLAHQIDAGGFLGDGVLDL